MVSCHEVHTIVWHYNAQQFEIRGKSNDLPSIAYDYPAVRTNSVRLFAQLLGLISQAF